MLISRRSALIGSAAALASPAIARAALFIPRNQLAYPGGLRKPGFDRTHPAAGSNMRYSGIAAPGGAFINLLDGTVSTPTGGALSTVIAPIIGKGVSETVSTRYNSIANVYSDSPTAVTMAVIFMPTGSVASFNSVIFSTKTGSVSGNAALAVAANTRLFSFYNNGSVVSPTGAPALVSNVPYFLLVSWAASGAYSWAVVNLNTGQRWSGNPTSGLSTIVGTSSWGIGTSLSSVQPFGVIASAMYSINNLLPYGNALQWAADPWSFWYPPSALERMVLRGTIATVNPASNVSNLLTTGVGQ